MTTNNFIELSIQIRLSGLSFSIRHRKTNRISYLKRVDFERNLGPVEVLEQLKVVLNSEDALSKSFDKVLVVYQNELSNLVPQALFDESQSADYLKFNAKIFQTDVLSHDFISQNKSVNVYVAYANINNYIFEVFGAFEYKHSSTVFIESVLEKETVATDTKLYIHVEKQHFEIVVISKSQLLLYNTFEYFSKEDFIYYVLFCIEQLRLDRETLIVKLSGLIAVDDPLYTLLFQYIRFVDFDTTPSFVLDEAINTEQLSHHFIILNSFTSCASYQDNLKADD